MPANVFISHIIDDSRIAETLRDAILADFLGMTEVFVSSDLQTIQAGTSWLGEVERGLDRAHLLLVLCSRSSIAQPWINFEAGAAWLKRIPIVPICHSGMELALLPMPMVVMQGLSLTDPRGLERLYLRIAQVLGAKAIPKCDFEALASKLSALQRIAPPSVPKTTLSMDPNSLLQDTALQRAIDTAQLGWTLCFVGEDQSDKVAQLTQDLEEAGSEVGNGKCFASGFSYWGIGPTLAWARACTDPAYIVAKKSIESFPIHWKAFAARLAGYAHYISLGPGTGHKDRSILRTLLDWNEQTYFLPVDMSGEMLRIAIAECRKNEDLKRSLILPIQVDFSTKENAASIWGLVNSVAGNSPALFSLLGNTLANFDNDIGLLEVLASMLRLDDKLLLEVATTEEVSMQKAERAGAEYRRSESFFAFATSAVDYYTSLKVDQSCVEFLPSFTQGEAIQVRTVYRNKAVTEIPLKITTGRQVLLAPGETIRLYLTRKYLESRVLAMLESAQLNVEHISRSSRNPDGFASMLILATPRR